MPQKKKAIVYSLKGCSYCVKCKKHLRDRGYVVKEYCISRGDTPHTLPDGRTRYTYPQVFLVVGGYTDTVAKVK